MNTAAETEPKVGKPGGGLPFYEWFLAKYILFPSIYKKTSCEQAKKFFQNETTKILALTEDLAESDAQKRVLIPRLRGLEDNSRYWSVTMALEHLAIVDSGIAAAVKDLTEGGTNKKPVLIQDVKPDSKTEFLEAREAFQKASGNFIDSIDTKALEKYPKATYPHPWFGPLNAREWYILAGRHQSVHRQQIKNILERLKH